MPAWTHARPWAFVWPARVLPAAYAVPPLPVALANGSYAGFPGMMKFAALMEVAIKPIVRVIRKALIYTTWFALTLKQQDWLKFTCAVPICAR